MNSKLLNTNIYQITPYYPPNLGGMQNCVKEVSTRLSDHGYKVTVITSNISYVGNQPKIRINKNLEVNYLKSIEIAHTPLAISLLSELNKITPRSLLHIHVANAFFPEISYLFCKLKKVPYIVHYHIDVESSGIFGHILPLYKKYILKTVLQSAKKVISLSTTQKSLLMEKYSLQDDQIAIVPNGINELFFGTKRKINVQAKKLLYVGRLSKQKNITSLIHAISLLDTEFELHIVGEGDQRDIITSFIKTLKLPNVFLHGAQYGESLKSFYHNADIFVLPSINEGMSLALLEATAMGLPIITTGLPQTKVFLKSGALFVSDPTPDKLAMAIRTLSLDMRSREKMSEYNLDISKNYSWTRILDKIENIYQEII